jgi:hypothetical protein
VLDAPHVLHKVGEVVLGDEREADMRGDPQVEGGEPDPEVGEPFHLYGFVHGIEDVFVGEGAICFLLHLLHFNFGVVEGQAHEGGEQACPTSASSIDSIEEGSWRAATKWILRLRKRLNVQKSTLYLSISYLWRLVRQGCVLTEANYERIAATLVLMSAKMNEIYPPKMNTLIQKCSKPLTRDDLANTEAWVLGLLDYDMSFPEITFSIIALEMPIAFTG